MIITALSIPQARIAKNELGAIVPADTLRCLVFQREGGMFFIDQFAQQIAKDHIYVIPPLHTYFLQIETTGDVISIDVPFAAMTEDCKQALYHINFWENKAFNLIGYPGYYNLLNRKYQQGSFHPFEDQLLSPLSRSVKRVIARSLPLNSSYQHVVDKYLAFMANVDDSVEPEVEEIARELNVHKQTLRRAFRHVLQRSVKEVTTQYVISKTVFLLCGPHQETIWMSAIADRLGFSNESDFARYFKNRTGCSPTQFRRYAKQQVEQVYQFA